MKTTLLGGDRRWHVDLCFRSLLMIAGAHFAFASSANAATIESLGIGTEFLLGGDLTDPEDDGDEAAGPDDPSWNWVSIDASIEPAFNNGESAFNVFDNVLGPGDDKWCCDDATAEVPVNVTVEFEQPVRLTHFTISSANDTPGRDPVSWEIQGSTDGVTFEPIFTQDSDVAIWTERLEVMLITLDAPSLPYLYLRYEATDTPEPLHQLGEIEYFGQVGSGEDTDGDGMDDLWEELFGLDPAVNDAEQDPDEDGLTNIEEYELRTDPMNADTDEDGLSDSVETNTGTWNGLEDTGTDPRRPDTDGDGLLDGIENPDLPYLNASQPGTSPHVSDTDGDGANDGLEAQNGTDPTDPVSVTSIQFGGGQWTTRFVWSEAGGISSVETLQSLLDGETPNQLDVTTQTDFVHFHDNSLPPVFIDLVTPYPGLDAFNLDANGFGIEVTGEIFVRESGIVTFVCNSDDGFELFIDGVSVGSAGDRGRGNTFMPVELEAGVHDVRFLHWENGGGAGVTLAVGRTLGDLTTFTASAFELVRPFNVHDVVTVDSDGDGIDDFKETFFFEDLSRDGTGDFDGDGLTDKEELDLRVDPSIEDTDGDGLTDGDEVNVHSTDPALADTDGDTLSDGVEVNDLSTNPNERDSDGDEFDDNLEVALDTDPNSADSLPDSIVLVSPNGSTENLNTGADWSNGSPPAAGSSYVVIGSVASPARTSGASPTFAGDELSLLGPGAELIVGHTGSMNFESLVLRDAQLTAGGSGTITGSASFAGDNVIHTGGGVLKLNAQLSGDGNIHYTSGSPDLLAGSIDLGGPAGVLTGETMIESTTVRALTPGTLGTGTITVKGGGLVIDYSINSNGDLLIQGDGFNLGVNGNWVFRDLKAINEDGSVLFSFIEIAGEGTYSVADLQEALQTTEAISGTGTITFVGDTDGDSDDDGLLDSWEMTNFGDLSQTGTGDPDEDGLDNAGELLAGTDPNEADSDSDGLSDGDEVNTHSSSPLLADTDSDGLDDGEEVELGLDVRNADSDGDGLTDGDEVAGGSDPLDSASPVASLDVTMPGDPLVLVDGENDDDDAFGPPPAAEPATNAINDTTGKYLNFLDFGSGFIVTPSAGATIVTGIRLFPANDAPERDPASYVLEGSVAGPDGPFTVISEGSLDLPMDRNAPGLDIERSLFHQEVQFENTVSYVSYRLVFPTLRDSVTANSMQIGEVELLGVPGEAVPTIGGFDIEQIPGGVRLHLPEGNFTIEFSATMQGAWESIATGVTGSFDDTDAARVANPEGFYRAAQEE